MSDKEDVCPKCHGEKTGFFERYNNISVCDRCDGKGTIIIPPVIIKVEQLSIDELRVQFKNETDIPKEIYWDGEDYMYYGDDRDLKLMLDETRVRWFGWKACARANKLLKDGN